MGVAGLGPSTDLLRGLLAAEKASGVHDSHGGQPADPSAAVAVLWLSRSLAFQTAVLRGLLADRAAPLSAVARAAYTEELEPHHSWLLRGNVRAGLMSMPSRVEFCARLAPTAVVAEREPICYSEMVALIEVQEQILAEMRKLLTAFGFGT